MTMTATQTNVASHQRRLRATVQKLVIELGYLERCLSSGPQDSYLQIAATSIDTAIDNLNEHLSN